MELACAVVAARRDHALTAADGPAGRSGSPVDKAHASRDLAKFTTPFKFIPVALLVLVSVFGKDWGSAQEQLTAWARRAGQPASADHGRAQLRADAGACRQPHALTQPGGAAVRRQ